MGGARLTLLLATLAINYFGTAICTLTDLPAIGQLDKSSDPGFDLLLLVRTWPPTFCEQLREMREECTLGPVEAFTIHGLWPQYATGGWPQYCPVDATRTETSPIKGTDSAEENSKQKIQDGEDDDEKSRCEWPSFHGSTSSFWDHEWSRHGTCAAPLLGNRTEFFKTVVQLHDKYDLNRLFQSNAVWPWGNSQGTFSSADAEKVVKNAWGVNPRLACHKGSVSEVWLCVDLDLNLVECPIKVHPGEMCGNQFRMPPGQEVNNEISVIMSHTLIKKP